MTLAFGLLALVAGVLVGRTLGPGPAVGLLIVGSGAGVVTWGFRAWPRVVAVVVAGGCLGCAVLQRADHGRVVSPFASLVATHARVRLVGRLVDDPSVRNRTAQVIVRTERVARVGEDGGDGGRRRVRVVASGEWANRLAVLEAGDSVSLTGLIEGLSPRDRAAEQRHAVAGLRVTGLDGFAASPSGVMAAANVVRRLVLRGIAPMPMPARALAAGFLLGDTGDIPAETVAAFRASGLSHLLAVSGANLAFAAACVAPFLRRFGLTGRFVGGVGVVLLFGAMTRFEPSVMRASAMALLVLLADRLGRPAPALRMLGLATGALVIIDPYLVFRVGFQLSVGATFGLAAFLRPIAARLRGSEGTRLALATPLAAQLGVLPISLLAFGSSPMIGIPANVLAEPLAGPATVVGLVAALVGGIIGAWVPEIAAILQYPMVGLLGAIDAIATLAARVPLAVDGRGSCAIAAIACGGAAGWAVWSRSRGGGEAANLGPD